MIQKTQEEFLIDFLGGAKFHAYLKILKLNQKCCMEQSNYGLTDAEIVALRAYTDNSYYELNQVLRRNLSKFDNEKIEKLKEFGNVISSGLAKIPTTSGIMRRDINLSQEMLSLFSSRIGKRVQFTAFTSSCNTLRKVMDGKFNCRMELISRAGKSVANFSEYGKKENEVLFNKDTVFVIKSVRQDSKQNGVTVIELEEATETQ